MNARAGEIWLLDLGNSRAKLARLAHGEPVDVAALDWTQQDFASRMRQYAEQWPPPSRILVASVARAELADRVRDLLPIAEAEIEWLRTPRQACGVGNRYAKPERLGIDRFLSMVAVHARTGGAGLVIGCGTAMTLDAVSVNGEHAAGLIALSPGRMLEALRVETAIAASNPDAFSGDGGDDTAAALQAGCWSAAGALVEWFAARHRAGTDEARVWLHGGWSVQLAQWLARDGFHAEVFEHAVLHGLAVWSAASRRDRA